MRLESVADVPQNHALQVKMMLFGYSSTDSMTPPSPPLMESRGEAVRVLKRLPKINASESKDWSWKRPKDT